MPGCTCGDQLCIYCCPPCGECRFRFITGDDLNIQMNPVENCKPDLLPRTTWNSSICFPTKRPNCPGLCWRACLNQGSHHGLLMQACVLWEPMKKDCCLGSLIKACLPWRQVSPWTRISPSPGTRTRTSPRTKASLRTRIRRRIRTSTPQSRSLLGFFVPWMPGSVPGQSLDPSQINSRFHSGLPAVLGPGGRDIYVLVLPWIWSLKGLVIFLLVSGIQIKLRTFWAWFPYPSSVNGLRCLLRKENRSPLVLSIGIIGTYNQNRCYIQRVLAPCVMIPVLDFSVCAVKQDNNFCQCSLDTELIYKVVKNIVSASHAFQHAKIFCLPCPFACLCHGRIQVIHKSPPLMLAGDIEL